MTKEEINKKIRTETAGYNNVSLLLGTGVGKSRVSLDMLVDRNITRNILIVVAEIAHINNWKDEILKWHPGVFSKITIICYASLKKVVGKHYNAAIYDEAHHMGSIIRWSAFKGIYSPVNFFLSATMTPSILQNLSSLPRYKVVTFSLSTAIDEEVLAEPVIYRHRIKLTGPERSEYDKLEADLLRAKSKYGSSGLKKDMLRMVHLGSKRKAFLGTCTSKVEAVEKLIEELGDRRHICFCTNIEQANLLNPANSIHSGKRKPGDIIDRYNAEEVNSLYAVGMLTEGVNLKNVDVGIIVQLDGSTRLFVQKLGRLLRSKNPEVHIFTVDGTKDDALAYNALQSFDQEYIKVVQDTLPNKEEPKSKRDFIIVPEGQSGKNINKKRTNAKSAQRNTTKTKRKARKISK